MSFKGIDIRQSSDRLIFRASLKDTDGAKITTGSAALLLYEIQSDATLKSYDFADNTFKSTAPTLGSGLLQQRAALNGTMDTGLWMSGLTTLTGFTRGNIYISQIYHTSASPAFQEREFQFGEGEGDFTTNAAGAVNLAGNQTVIMTGSTVGVQLDLTQTISGMGSSGTVGDALKGAIVQAFGQWTLSGTTLTLKSPDGTATYRVFTLDSATTPTSRT